MQELVFFPDAEHVVIDYLLGRIGSVPIDVRRGSETPFIRVRRVGGTEEDVAIDHPTIDVYVWHNSDRERMALANALWGVLRAAAGDLAGGGVLTYKDTVLGPRQMPDPADDTKTCCMFTVTMLSARDTSGGYVPPVLATVAVAGKPGYFLPDGAIIPGNLSAMSTVSPSPATKWTNPEYVVLGDGSHAEWSGTAWRLDTAVITQPV